MDGLLISFLIFGFMIVFASIRKKFVVADKQVYRTESNYIDLDGKSYY